MYNKEIETLPLEKLRKLQSERLVNLVNRVYKTVPFYKNLFDESGIDVSSIKSINDIHRLPFTKKTDLRDQYPFGFLTVPENQLARIHCSSGTTGKPTVVGYTTKDLDIFSEVVARSLAAGGAKPGMKIHNSYGYGLFTGGIGIHYGAEKLGMSVVPVSVGMTDRQITLLQDFQPEVICCTPSYAQTIAFELEKRNLKISDLNLKYAILGAEPWTEAIRSDIEASLGVKATNIYVWGDHFFPEIVDKDTGEPLPYGEEGVLVFTTLTKEAMPFLRYWTNDICSLSYDHSTSRTHIKMGQIKGRSDDMLIIRGVNLFHTQIEEIIKEYKELAPNYQLIVTKNGLTDQVEVKVETNSDFQIKLGLESGFKEDEVLRNSALASMSNQLKKNIKDKVGLSIKVTLNCYGAIPKSEGGKLNRIIDLRNS